MVLSPLTQKSILGIALMIFLGGGFTAATTYWVQQNNYAIQVNGQRISKTDYLRREKQMQQFLSTQKLPEAVIKQLTLNELIERELLLQAAHKQAISVTSEEIQKEWDQILTVQYNGSHERMLRDLGGAHYTEKDFRTELLDRLKAQKMRQEISEKEAVSEADLKAYYEQHKSEYQDPEKVEAQHILLHIDDKDPQSEQKIKAQAISLIQKLQGGADFAELAKKYSDDTTNNTQAGHLPNFGKGEMVEPFEKAVWQLQPGQITAEPVRTEFGWHIIKRGKTIPAGLRSFTSAKTSFEARFKQQKQEEAVQDWLKQQREAAQIVYHPDFQTAVQANPSSETKSEASSSPDSKTKPETSPAASTSTQK